MKTMMVVIPIVCLLILGTYVKFFHKFPTQYEKDITSIRQAMDKVVCVHIDMGICLCKNESSSEFDFSSFHCSLLPITTRIYSGKKIFKELKEKSK